MFSKKNNKYNQLLENQQIKYKTQSKSVDIQQISFIMKFIIKKNKIQLYI